MSQDLFVEPCYIRAMHRQAFRFGDWAEVAGVKMARGRPCYLVLWNDGRSDLWPVDDQAACYEFSAKRPKPINHT